MKTIHHTCPHCQATFDIPAPESDPFAMERRFLQYVHCDDCAELKKASLRPQTHIDNLNHRIRGHNGSAEELDKLHGSLRAQHSSRLLLKKKLEGRRRKTSQTLLVDKNGPKSLPW